jgi:hypothetical protein
MTTLQDQLDKITAQTRQLVQVAAVGPNTSTYWLRRDGRSEARRPALAAF